MYRIETHLHTTYISHCGWLGAQAIMKYYSACGMMPSALPTTTTASASTTPTST